jgi:hypothetical protein
MKKLRVLFAVTAVLTVSASSVFAHHGRAAAYDM